MEDVARWKRAREIFDAVVDLPPREQRVQVHAACGSDRALQALIESLLAHDDPSSDPIKPVVVAAARDRASEDRLLEPGKTMLHYGLTAKIGEGGMGVVWKATDFMLGREVAIKVLPAGFATDASRLARFEREAKLLATLNHSNIASIYSLHEDRGRRFLAMEYVEGDDLSVRLQRGALPVPDVMAIALQIAEALEEAHAKGIVHRDLKPANVKMKADGKVKVLDFGLAKVESANGSEIALSSSAMVVPLASTNAGLILGTAAYMPPEQARGLNVDKRADIWAFGVMLFEMLSGKRPFDGATLTDVLAAVVTVEPDLELLPRGTPPALVHLISRCLQKDTRQRLRDIGDARIEIERIVSDTRRVEATVPPSRRNVMAWVGAAIAAIAVAAGTSRWMVSEPGSAASVTTSALQIAMVNTERAARARVASVPAYNAYLQGKHFLQLNTRESVDKAGTYFAEAVRMDPAFAPAWAGLAMARSVMGTEGFAPPDTVFGEARRAAERAVSLDPELAEGHFALSAVRRVYDWEWAGANAAAQRALQLAPDNAQMILGAARIASTLGRLEEAVVLSRRAASLDPLNVQVHSRLARYEFFLGQFERARASFAKVLELNPEYPTAHHGLARVLLAQGKPDEALTQLAGETSSLWRVFGEALIYWSLDRRAEADAALRRFIDGFQDTAPSQIANVYAYRGQLDDALAWLERAYMVRDTGLSQLKALPEFRRIEHEPRYRAFLDKMALPY